MPADDSALLSLVRTIAAGDEATALRLIAASPSLARTRIATGATRQAAKQYFLDEIGHYVYAGDTVLHVAAASSRPVLVEQLIAAGADVRARNRRGAEPLHYAVNGQPDSAGWNPLTQAATIACLIAAGAAANAVDKSGVAPLHRAVRNRCAVAVQALLDGGADVRLVNGSGTTPIQLATMTTGKSGSGSEASKTQQAEIVRLLEEWGATR